MVTKLVLNTISLNENHTPIYSLCDGDLTSPSISRLFTNYHHKTLIQGIQHDLHLDLEISNKSSFLPYILAA